MTGSSLVEVALGMLEMGGGSVWLSIWTPKRKNRPRSTADKVKHSLIRNLYTVKLMQNPTVAGDVVP